MSLRITDLYKLSGRFLLDENGDLQFDEYGKLIEDPDYANAALAEYNKNFQNLKNKLDSTEYKDKEKIDALKSEKNTTDFDLDSYVALTLSKNKSIALNLFLQHILKKGCELKEEYAEWLAYTYEEILEMEANGILIPDEVIDWAHEQKQIYEPQTEKFYEDALLETMLTDLDNELMPKSEMNEVAQNDGKELEAVNEAQSTEQVEQKKEALQEQQEAKEEMKDITTDADALAEYNLTSESMFGKIVEAGEKSTRMAEEAKKEVKEASKELNSLVSKRNQVARSEEATNNQEIESLDSEISAKSAEKIDGVEKLEKFQDKNAEYTEFLNKTDAAMGITTTYGVMAITGGITSISIGSSLLATAATLMTNPFTAAIGAAMATMGSCYVGFGVALTNIGEILTVTGLGGTALGVESRLLIETSEKSIDESIAVMNGEEVPEKNAAEQELLDMQSSGAGLLEQTVHFGAKSAEETLSTIGKEIELGLMGVQSDAERVISDLVAENIEKKSENKKEKIEELQEKRNNFNEKIQAAKAEGKVPNINAGEYFSSADISALEQAQQELNAMGTQGQDRLGKALGSVYEMYETLETGEISGENAINYGNVTLDLSETLAEQSAKFGLFGIGGLVVAAGAAISGAAAVTAGESIGEIYETTSEKVDTAMTSIGNNQATVADATGIGATMSVVETGEGGEQENSNGLNKQLQTNEAGEAQTQDSTTENLPEYVQSVANQIANTGRDSERMGNEAKTGVDRRFAAARAMEASANGLSGAAKLKEFQNINEGYAEYVNENGEGMKDMTSLGLAVSSMAMPMMMYGMAGGKEMFEEGRNLVQAGREGIDNAKTSTTQIEESNAKIDEALENTDETSPSETENAENVEGNDINASNAISEANEAKGGLLGIIDNTNKSNDESVKRKGDSEKTEKQVENEKKVTERLIKIEEKKIEKLLKDTFKSVEEQLALNAELEMLGSQTTIASAKLQASQNKAQAQQSQGVQGGLIAPAGQVDYSAMQLIQSNQGRMNEITTRSNSLSVRVQKNQKLITRSSITIKKYHTKFEKLRKEKLKIQEQTRKAEEAKQKKIEKDLAIVNVFNTIGSIIISIGTIIAATGLGIAIGGPIIIAGAAVVLICGTASAAIQMANGNLTGGLMTLATTIIQVAMAVIPAAGGMAAAAAGTATAAVSTAVSTVSQGMQIAGAAISITSNAVQMADDITFIQTGERNQDLQIASQVIGALGALTSLGNGMNFSNGANSAQSVGKIFSAVGQVMSSSAAISSQIKQQNGDKNTEAENIVAIIGSSFSLVGALTSAGGAGKADGVSATQKAQIAGQAISATGQFVKAVATTSANMKAQRKEKDTKAEQVASIVGDSLVLAGSVISSVSGMAQTAGGFDEETSGAEKAAFAGSVINDIGKITTSIAGIVAQAEQLKGDKNATAAQYIQIIGQAISLVGSLVTMGAEMATQMEAKTEETNAKVESAESPALGEDNNEQTPPSDTTTTTDKQVAKKDNDTQKQKENSDAVTKQQTDAQNLTTQMQDLQQGGVKNAQSLSATQKAAIAGQFIVQTSQMLSAIANISAAIKAAAGIKDTNPEKYLQLIGQSIAATGSVVKMGAEIKEDIDRKTEKQQKENEALEQYERGLNNKKKKERGLKDLDLNNKASVEDYKAALAKDNRKTRAINNLGLSEKEEKNYTDEEKIKLKTEIEKLEAEDRKQATQERLQEMYMYAQYTQQFMNMGMGIAQSAIALAESKAASATEGVGNNTLHLSNTRQGRALMKKIRSRRRI